MRVRAVVLDAARTAAAAVPAAASWSTAPAGSCIGVHVWRPRGRGRLPVL